MDEKKSYLHICVDGESYDTVLNILDVFMNNGYFDEDKFETAYETKTDEFSITINGMRSSKTAWLIGDVLEAALGRHLEWFHYSEDPDEEDYE